jgi:hypothetical protein
MGFVFRVAWTDDGLAVFRAGEGPDTEDPLETMNPYAVVVRWRDLRELVAIEPWPAFRIRWASDGGGGEITCTPKDQPFWHADEEEFGELVEALFAHVGEHAPGRVRRGWLKYPKVEWEQVNAMPQPLPDRSSAGEGAYRSGPRAVEEVAIAVREPPSAFESMLAWVASGPYRSRRHMTRGVRLTEEHVYVERRDGTFWRLPLSMLRERRGDASGDALYVFGRGTLLFLVERRGCPVAATLEALAARRASGGPAELVSE